MAAIAHISKGNTVTKDTTVSEVAETVVNTPLNKKVLVAGAAVLVTAAAVYVVAKIRAKKATEEIVVEA